MILTGKHHQEKVGKCKPPVHSRFKPGVSGNPKGRPPEPQILKDLRRMCREADNAGDIYEMVLNLAKKGNFKAIELMAHYGAGKPADTVHQTTEKHEDFLRRLIDKEKLKNADTKNEDGQPAGPGVGGFP